MRIRVAVVSYLAFALLQGCQPRTPAAPLALVAAPASTQGASEVLRARAPQPLDEPPIELAPTWSSKLSLPGARPRLVLDRYRWILKAGAFSDDGHLAAAIDDTDMVVLWDTATARELRRFNIRGATERRSFGATVAARECQRVGRLLTDRLIAFTRDNRRLVVMMGGCVQIWDVVTGTRTLMVEGDSRGWTKDLRTILIEPGAATLGKFSSAIIDTEQGKLVLEIADWIPSALSPDGARFMAYRRDGEHSRDVFETTTGRRISTIPATGGVWSPSGKLLASGSSIIEVETGRVISKINGLRDSEPFEFVAGERILHVKGRQFASVDVRTGRAITPIVAHESAPFFRETTLVWFDFRHNGAPHGVDTVTGKRLSGQRLADEASIRPRGDDHVLARHPNGLALRRRGGTELDALVNERDGTRRILHEGAAIELRHAGTSSRLLLGNHRFAEQGDGQLFMFDLASGETLLERRAPYDERQRRAPQIPGISSDDGAWLVLGKQVHAIGERAPSETFPGKTALAVGPNRAWILARDAMYRREAAGFRAVSFPPIPKSPDFHGDPYENASHAVTPDGNLVVTGFTQTVLDTGSKLGGLIVWNGQTGAPVFQILPDKTKPFQLDPPWAGVSIDPAGKRIGVGGNVSLVLDARTGTEILKLLGGGRIVFDHASDRLARVTSTEAFVYEANGTQVARLTHEHDLHGFGFLPQRDFVISSDGGVLRIWDVRTQREAVKIAFLGDGRWVAIDPAGRFDTNDAEHVGELAWSAPHEPLTLLSFESFMRDYYQPGLLGRVLARVGLDEVPDLSALNVVKPVVEIDEVTETAGKLTIGVRVRDVVARDASGAARTAGPRDVRLFRDGRLVGRQPAVLGGSAYVVFDDIALPTGAKQVELSAYAFNSSGVKSATAVKAYVPTTTSTAAPPSPKRRAFLVHVGIDRYADPALQLDFAVADANALADRLAASLATEYDVRTIRILGGQRVLASREALIAVLRKLAGTPGGIDPAGITADLEPATPDDLVVISFAGHGVSTASGRFHLLFGDYAGGDPDVARAGTLDDRRLAAELAALDAGEVVVVIDACQSGGAVDAGGFKPGPLGAKGFGQMAYDKRIRVLAASQADDVALESRSIGHGLLTYALAIDGLDQRGADFKPRDGTITISEWLAWGAARVPALADAIVSNEPGARGLQVVRQPRRHAVAQQPRLFDDLRRPSTIPLRTAN